MKPAHGVQIGEVDGPRIIYIIFRVRNMSPVAGPPVEIILGHRWGAKICNIISDLRMVSANIAEWLNGTKNFVQRNFTLQI